jgi:hypothetical protein
MHLHMYTMHWPGVADISSRTCTVYLYPFPVPGARQMPVEGLMVEPTGSLTAKEMYGLGCMVVAPANPWTVRPKEDQEAGSG